MIRILVLSFPHFIPACCWVRREREYVGLAVDEVRLVKLVVHVTDGGVLGNILDVDVMVLALRISICFFLRIS